MQRINYGKAVIECPQEIPCNPCVTICKTGAITKKSLTAIPDFYEEKCFGCRLCVAACPGQAVFMVNEDFEPGYALVSFPYEYRPLPSEAQSVIAVDRKGEEICDATIIRVDNRHAFNRTTVITIRIPSEHTCEVRFIKRLSEKL